MKYKVYVGYYEVFITTHDVAETQFYFLSSQQKSADLATKRVEKNWPSAEVYYDEESYRDYFGQSPEDPQFSINGIKFY